jgi:hypothetical protein
MKLTDLFERSENTIHFVPVNWVYDNPFDEITATENYYFVVFDVDGKGALSLHKYYFAPKSEYDTFDDFKDYVLDEYPAEKDGIDEFTIGRVNVTSVISSIDVGEDEDGRYVSAKLAMIMDGILSDKEFRDAEAQAEKEAGYFIGDYLDAKRDADSLASDPYGHYGVQREDFM